MVSMQLMGCYLKSFIYEVLLTDGSEASFLANEMLRLVRV